MKFRYQIISLVMAALLTGALPTAVFASTQDQLDETNSEIDALESEQADLESALASYQSSLSELAEDLEEIVSQIDDKQAEIDAAQLQIDELQTSIDDQEALICDRAQYVYENNGSSSLQILLSSSSFADFLNKVQFLSELNAYDNDLVDEYNALCSEMTQMKEALETEMADLQTLRDESAEKQENMYTLIEETNTQIANNESAIASAEATAAALEEEIEEAKIAADLASAQAIAEEESSSSSGSSSDSSASSGSSSGSSSASGSSSDSSSSSGSSSDSSSSSGSSSDSASTDDAALLAAIIYCEAGGESYEGQVAVGSVIMNRVNSSRFPNTISGVVYQSGQFTPASNGKLAKCISNKTYSSSCVSAASAVLSGTNNVPGCYYFCTVSSYKGSGGTVIGNHVFY